jgi:hypothetical protein
MFAPRVHNCVRKKGVHYREIYGSSVALLRSEEPIFKFEISTQNLDQLELGTSIQKINKCDSIYDNDAYKNWGQKRCY